MSFAGIAREKSFAKGRYKNVKQYAVLRADREKRYTFAADVE
ncbi:hypothetical protein [Sporomusa acidovorans]|uniref:Uncharacterized protein n=1 Tax=Sporomusa acidovorans (strain ATCC 49682 / DSM 3132 / Mol) TaxID=1123286 RepID=A0ABZ3J9I6_SPOA4|nr:hypothetical protein [Sporomusa acidovorans]OZC15967.1 hypothetical protein SPACI_43330 [Sporomusa acidovorans DSM 3132]SDD91816.1 hypothetical protein SAMN04488499_1005164 [Sporomusa acidovorans]